MIYHPLLRNLLCSAAFIIIIFRWSHTLLWDPRLIVTIVIFNVAGLLLQTRVESSVSSRTSKRNELGFKVLSPGENPVVDIVAIHGLGGHRERSWTAANGKMWLKDFLADDIPNARILTYGHDADTYSHTYMPAQSLLSLAEAFVDDLSLERSSNPERPIIFLAHSFGGIILMQALINCHVADNDRDKQRIKVSTYATLFFGTPLFGANGVGFARWIGSLLSFYMFTDDTILRYLHPYSAELQALQSVYFPTSERIKSIFFYEELPTEMITGIAEWIVPRPLAIIQGDRNAIMAPLYADHRKMVKFLDKDDNNYRKVVGRLSNLVGEAPAEVERNWNEKKHKNTYNGEVQPHSRVITPKRRPLISRNYVRRRGIEIFLTEKLLGSNSPGIQPRCVLHGLGGSGKTQVASFWIEANKDQFHPVIFIDASSEKQIEADLERAIRSVGPEWSEATWEDAVSYLSMRERWFLLFDNVAILDSPLEDYLPTSTSGAILITTRNRDYTDYAPDSHLQVGGMTEREAVNLLHKVADVRPSSDDASIAIVKELGMFALAVTQVGASILQKTHLDKVDQLNGYLGNFRKNRAELLREKGINYKGSTYAAFDPSFGLLPEKAKGFMKICAFLYHSHIPQALFEKSIKNRFRCGTNVKGYPETETLISCLKSIFGSNWDDDRFQKLIKPILQGSLLDGFLNRDKRTFYNIHPLVQTYIQDLLAPTDQDHYALSAGQLLLGGIQLLKRDNQWDQELLPHIDNLPTRVREKPGFSDTFRWYIAIKRSQN
ncbi:hypothetical protein CPB86DRAFT_826561 [Serendipita vermifera]|nr:hypothetical protein CPB86DRAFT_826561 [Serendipita vermifera]